MKNKFSFVIIVILGLICFPSCLNNTASDNPPRIRTYVVYTDESLTEDSERDRPSMSKIWIFDRYENLILTFRFQKEPQFEYDANGNIVSFVTYDLDGSRYTETTLTYNATGNVIGTVVYNLQEASKTRESFEYDDNGKLIETFQFDEAESLKSHTVFEYDDRDSLIENIRYTQSGSLENKTTYKHDEDGKLLQMDYSYPVLGSLKLFDSVKFKDGRQIEAIHYAHSLGESDSSSIWSTTTYKYIEFDEYENWTMCEASEQMDEGTGDILTHQYTLRRVLSYYD